MAPNGTRTVKVRFDGSVTGLADAARRADQDVSKVGRNSGSLLGGAVALGLSAAAPVVAAGLIGGVSLGFIGMAALVQKNNVAVQDSFGALKNQVVDEMTSATDQVVPHLVKAGHSLQQEFANLGPQLHEAFSFAGPDIDILTSGVDTLADNAMPGLVTSMRNSKPIVQGISTVLGDLGTTTTTLLTDLSAHSDEFGRDLDQVGSLIENVGSVAGAVLPGLASGFGTTVGTLNSLLGALTPIAPVVGDITGEVLPAVGAWKLFGLATEPLGKLGGKIAGASSKVGNFSSTLTRSATVGTKAANATTALGGAVAGLGKALPLVGVGLALADAGAQRLFGSVDKLQSQLLAGGKQTGEALDQLATNNSTLVTVAKNLPFVGGAISAMVPTLADAKEGLTDVQKAQVNYNIAVHDFPPGSKQVVAAQKALATAAEQETVQQDKQNRAMEKTSQSLLNQTNATLGLLGAQDALQSAQLGVTQAEKDYAAAVKKSGPNSLAAKEALLGLNEAFKTDITNAGLAAQAVDEKAKADGKSISPSQEATDANNAQRREVNRLIQSYAASGKAIPASLQNIAAGMNDTGAQAAETAGDIQHVTNTLAKVPPGKQVTVAALTQAAINRLTSLGFKVTHLKDGKFGVVANTKTARNTIDNFVRAESGKTIFIPVKGVVSPSTGRALFGPFHIGQRAAGGPVVKNRPYIVGEHQPELFVPNQNGTIIPRVPAASTPSGGGDGFSGDLYLTLDIGEGIKHRLRIENRELRRAVRSGSAIR